MTDEEDGDPDLPGRVHPALQALILAVSLVVIGAILIATDRDILGFVAMLIGVVAGAGTGARVRAYRRGGSS